MRSRTEKRFLDLFEAPRMPTPATNINVSGFELDA